MYEYSTVQELTAVQYNSVLDCTTVQHSGVCTKILLKKNSESHFQREMSCPSIVAYVRRSTSIHNQRQ